MPSYGCGNRCGVDMEYIGGGDWKCPECGRVIAFGEPDDDDYDEGEANLGRAILMMNGDEDYDDDFVQKWL